MSEGGEYAVLDEPLYHRGMIVAHDTLDRSIIERRGRGIRLVPS